MTVNLPPLPDILIEPLLRNALAEDLGRAGDITTSAVIPPEQPWKAALVARQAGVIAGLDLARFVLDVERHSGAGRIAEDVDSADLSGVSGTPTFFIDGRRHDGAYDIATLSEAVRSARARVSIER